MGKFEFEGVFFMSAIKIENLTFSYYGYVKPVFENVSFSFDTNWKIGLIGRNGIGKSTLFPNKSNDYLKKSPVYGHFRKTAA